MTEGSTLDPCAQAEEHLQSYFDHVLSAEVAAAIETHLATCSDCARAYAFEERFRAFVKSSCGGNPDEHCREEFRRKLEGCRQAASIAERAAQQA
jgi:anti-sigma factor (TIGR02949 family)